MDRYTVCLVPDDFVVIQIQLAMSMQYVIDDVGIHSSRATRCRGLAPQVPSWYIWGEALLRRGASYYM